MERTRDVIRPRHVFGAATVLGFFSAFQAYYFVSTFTERPGSFPMLLALNLNYWYSWALLTPGILWLARRFPFQSGRWALSVPVHVVGVVVATLLHVGLSIWSRMGIYWAAGEPPFAWLAEAQRMFFLNFDWEMMTYWAIVGLSHAIGYHYEARDRALSESQLETRLVEAQLQALQRQLQPHFLFNTLNAISALMHRDVEAADEMIARLSDLLRLSLQTVGVQEVPLKDELDFLSKYLER
ncbi:MAG: histidine kinase, partial [Vicinamibacterales bacterium]